MDITAPVTNPNCVPSGSNANKFRQFWPDDEAVGAFLTHGSFFDTRQQNIFMLLDFKSAHMGKGYGGLSLEFLSEIADKNKVRLELRASPEGYYDEEKNDFVPLISQDKLCEVYGNYGFFLQPRANDHAPVMIRPPQRTWF